MKLDQVFGIHEQALRLRARRAEVLAANLANADTPGYKARDLDFQAILRGQTMPQVRLAATRPGHIAASPDVSSAAVLQYRVPQQPSLDGNTVEVEREQVEYSANAVQYQATLRFIDGTLRTLRTAIKGSAQ